MTHPVNKELDDLRQIINTTDDADEFERAWMKFQIVRFIKSKTPDQLTTI